MLHILGAVEDDGKRVEARSARSTETAPAGETQSCGKCGLVVGRETTHNGKSADPSRWGMPTVMSEEPRDVPAFACCSVGIGRWYWVAWESEAEARALSPAVASGYEASADRAEGKAAERVGPRMKRLPARWASGYKRRGGTAARVPGTEREPGGGSGTGPRSRFGRPGGPANRHDVATRLAFLYCAAGREPPD